jgi:hypothetical protein
MVDPVQITNALYWVFGFLIVSNLTLAFTAARALVKFSWFCSKLDSGLKENKKDIGNTNNNFRELREDTNRNLRDIKLEVRKVWDKLNLNES